MQERKKSYLNKTSQWIYINKADIKLHYVSFKTKKILQHMLIEILRIKDSVVDSFSITHQ